MTKLDETVLKDADAAINGPRNVDYGHPLDNHRTTAELWNAYLVRRGVLRPLNNLTLDDVCMLNILQKVSRAAGGRITHDTLVDIAGYAANVEAAQGEAMARAIIATSKCHDEGDPQC